MVFEGKIKGTHLINIFKYIKHKRGVLGVQDFLEIINEGRLSPDLIDENSFVEKDWHPYKLYLRFLKVADEVVGNGDLSKCYDIGYRTVQNLGHLSYITRAPDVFEFVQAGSDNWHTVYDFGRPEAIRESDKMMIVRYHDFPPDKAKCEYFRGSLAGMIELCQLKGSVEQTICNEKIEDYSEYILEWE